MLLKGVGRLDAPRRQNAPVSVALLEECANALDLNDPADQALWGVLCLAFFFMLRRSEIAATTNTAFKWFALKAADVTTIDATGTPTVNPKRATAVCVRLSGSKTNQSGDPTTRMLARSRHPILCPVLGALLLLRSRLNLPASIPAAVFVAKNGTPSCVTASRESSAWVPAQSARILPYSAPIR
ncbi:hypothetical protein ON010_g8467 [Phytophthora cinnamomi]|nr:hypothetical protein ON010_g8467 [Phytophthora cinnamomi]